VIWYCKSALGKNTLADMMRKICKLAKLTNQYNNHSIRATSITLLDTQFASRDIMKISCHKSQTSIKNYSSKTSDDKLEKMSNFLHRTVVGTSTVSESAETSDESVDENQNIANDHVMTENISTDFVYLEQEQIDEL
jgi:dTDP-D-glucose 4,6-dehydratase